MLIAPSILTADFAALGDAAARAEAAGADWLHLDVMDGHFVPDLTYGPKMVADLRRRTRLPLDVHLMIERPERWTERYVAAGADSLTVHAEAMADPAAVLRQIRSRGARAGLAVSPGTPIERLIEHLAECDLALVMSVEPGAGGQRFIETALGRLRAVREAIDARSLRAELQVDGGVKVETMRRVAEAGATVAVAGSAIYDDPRGVEAAVHALREAAAPAPR